MATGKGHHKASQLKCSLHSGDVGRKLAPLCVSPPSFQVLFFEKCPSPVGQQSVVFGSLATSREAWQVYFWKQGVPGHLGIGGQEVSPHQDEAGKSSCGVGSGLEVQQTAGLSVSVAPRVGVPRKGSAAAGKSTQAKGSEVGAPKRLVLSGPSGLN